MLQILAVPLNYRAMVNRFIRVPWFIHREHAKNPYWVPPLILERQDFLNPAKNPFFARAEVALWIAVKDGRDVGRIAAILDFDYHNVHDAKTGYFGLFETTNDPEVTSALMNRAHDWLREKGMATVIGPMDMCQFHSMGLLIDAFDRVPGFQMPYNPPYYPERVEAEGYTKVKDVYQWGMDARTPIPERIVRIAEAIEKRDGVKLRNFDLKDWDREVDRALLLINDCWRDNWGFTPLSPREFHHMAKDMKMVLNPELGFFAEVNGEPVAFALTIKNLNPIFQKVDGKLFPFGALRLAWDTMIRPNVDSARLILLGIRSDYRRRGIDSLLFVATKRAALEQGYFHGEIGWTLEDNVLVNRAIEAMEGHKVATYRVYQRTL
jgi:GNAT superfamily N-acetyltransferase